MVPLYDRYSLTAAVRKSLLRWTDNFFLCTILHEYSMDDPACETIMLESVDALGHGAFGRILLHDVRCDRQVLVYVVCVHGSVLTTTVMYS